MQSYSSVFYAYVYTTYVYMDCDQLTDEVIISTASSSYIVKEKNHYVNFADLKKSFWSAMDTIQEKKETPVQVLFRDIYGMAYKKIDF
jgi:hypothetical protein